MSPLRKVMFQLHKWLGLNLALFFAFMFVTGSLLSLSDEAEKLIHPDIRAEKGAATTSASFGEIYDAITAQFPNGTPFVIVKQPIDGAGDRTNVNFTGGRRTLVWTDPQTADVLTITSARNFKDIVHQLHDSLLVPSRVAFLAVSGTSLILLYSVISGLVTYRRFWRGWFRFPSRNQTGRARWAAWHRLLGLWLSPFLLIMSVTSFYFFLGGLNLTGNAPQPPLAESREEIRGPNFHGALIDQAHVVVSEEFPWFQAKTAVLPGTPEQGIRFSGSRSGMGLVLYTVSVDPQSLAILGMVSTQDRGPMTDIKQLMNVLHYGTWGGTGIRYLWVGLGFLTSGLILAGAGIFVARNAPASTNMSGLRVFWQGLASIRWAYLAALIGVLAMVLLRFIL